MFSKKDFDDLAGQYDKTIERDSIGYPYEGYQKVLRYVQNSIFIEKDTKILDLGIGTGLLTQELFLRGADVVGVDFSQQMINQARLKMPEAKFFCFDFKKGFPHEFVNLRFNYIVSSYAIHHIDDENKVRLIRSLTKYLKENGKILIADVAFETREDLEICRASVGNKWDENEYYMIGASITRDLEKFGLAASYTQISICGGVLAVDLSI